MSRQARSDVLSMIGMIFTKTFKIGGSEVTVSSSCVGSHCLTLLCRFGEARLRRERQARSDVLSLWGSILTSAFEFGGSEGTVSFARVGSQRQTLLSLVGEAHLRHERHVKAGTL